METTRTVTSDGQRRLFAPVSCQHSCSHNASDMQQTAETKNKKQLSPPMPHADMQRNEVNANWKTKTKVCRDSLLPRYPEERKKERKKNEWPTTRRNNAAVLGIWGYLCNAFMQGKKKKEQNSKGQLKHVSLSFLHDQNHLWCCFQMIGQRCRKNLQDSCAWSQHPSPEIPGLLM